MLRRRKTKAQSTAEYAILLSLVVAAALGMQHEVRRAIQAKIYDANYALSQVQGQITSEGVTLGTTESYEPQSGNKNRSQTAKQTVDEVMGLDANSTATWWTKDAKSSTDFDSQIRQ
jgi:hypothetical protein